MNTQLCTVWKWPEAQNVLRKLELMINKPRYMILYCRNFILDMYPSQSFVIKNIIQSSIESIHKSLPDKILILDF